MVRILSLWSVMKYGKINLLMKHIFYLVLAVCVGIATYTYCQPKEETILLPEHPFYLLEDVNKDVLYQTLVHYKFPHPEIITAQAVLESGNFKSRLCLQQNNLFGLYNSKTLSYYNFDSWISCVFAYKKYILNKYKEGEDYYQFLERIGYAEDPNYITVLKRMTNEESN